MRQSFELAKIMVTGKTQNTNQYLNAHAIYFSKPFTGSRKIKAESVINNIDIYTTLLALDRTINSTEGALTRFNIFFNLFYLLTISCFSRTSGTITSFIYISTHF